MVSVRVNDEDAIYVAELMDRHQPIDPSLRNADYRKQGWTKFDPDAAPYVPTPEEINRMREPYRDM